MKLGEFVMINEIEQEKLSPMMKQYFNIKKECSDHILFFRLGDFYEMFFDDAIRASRMLELTLTGRDCGLEERAPMCGVPYHSAETYIKKLVELGVKVAVCEQVSDPKSSKGIVERKIIRIMTPGTLTESALLQDSKNNYIASIFAAENSCAISVVDISTGEVIVIRKTEKNLENGVINELSRYNPVEILFNQKFLDYKNVCDFIKNKLSASAELLDDDKFDCVLQKNVILSQFNAEDYDEIGIVENSVEASSLSAVFFYISDTQKALVGRFTEITKLNDDVFMELDLSARKNLELTETIRSKEKKGSLFGVLDQTKTSMGKRLLKSYIEQPLIKLNVITKRLDAVENLCEKSLLQQELSLLLANVYDIERLMTRVIYKTANPRDLKQLSVTALKLPEIKSTLENFDAKLLVELNEKIDTLSDISNLIENAIVDEPPVSFKDGGVIKDGFNEKLDHFRDVIGNGKNIIEKIAEREREATGIKNIKISYNRVFGYYIEVTKSYYDLVPDHYIRKQTLSNCERFITEELKLAENEILQANESILELESDIFIEVRNYVAKYLVAVQSTASAIAALDVLQTFAYVSMKNEYTKPEMAIDGVIDIKDGRHPVVESIFTEKIYVPNDTYLDLNYNRMSIITGPNMSGKSTFMRQVALITLMAQIGCFVPAKYAKISIVDKIFTRVGASDDLTSGQSTFMVEMNEVAEILKNATKNSLVILDEVGRGTSTFDGISIATSVAEYISNKKILGCKTLFATHYHELISLEEKFEGINNFSVAVKKIGEDIRFLHKIVRGGIDDSYGIEVAKLAGLPAKTLKRAKEILATMEAEKENFTPKTDQTEQVSFQVVSHENIIERLRKTNVNEFTPIEALLFLQELTEEL